MSEPVETSEASETKAPRFSRRWLLIGGIGFVLLLLAGGWLAWTFLSGDPDAEGHAPAAGHFLELPDVTVTLTDLPHLVRLGLIIETTTDTGHALDDPARQRMIEEIRRWLATQSLDELHGAAALWTVRSQALAIVRDLHPELPVRDVLIRTLILQ